MVKNIFTESELKYLKEKEFKKTYLQYIKIGLSVIPITPNGKPAIIDWEKHKNKRMDANEAEMCFNPSIHGIGIICGKVSNNLEVIVSNDGFQSKLIQGMLKDFGPKAESFASAGGVIRDQTSMFYFCEQIEKGQILFEKIVNGKRKICIESKGDGEIVMAPTSLEIGWDWITGTNIKEITPSERNKIFSIARTIDSIKK